MPITAGTSQVKLRNVSKIDFLAQYNDGEPVQNTMYGENIEQGVTITTTQGTTTTVANGAKVTTSEKVNVSWTLIGDTLEQMDASMYFSSPLVGSVGITVNSVRVTLIGGKTITITKPVISCARAIKTNDIIRYNFSIEKNNDNADTVVLFN